MRVGPTGIHAILATLTALAVMITAPLHSVHSHDDAATALHATCAVCQMHAPAGTPPDDAVIVGEPRCTGHVIEIPAGALHIVSHGRVDACRAPPVLLA